MAVSRGQLAFAAMRALDRRAGPLLARAVAPWLPRHAELPEDPAEIAIVKFLGLGALALAEPALRALRARYPRARLTLVTFSHHLELLPALGVVDRGLGVTQDGAAAFARSTRQALSDLRAARPEILLDLETSHFSALFAALSGAPARIGFCVPGWATHRLYSHTLTFAEEQHATERFLALAALAGASPPADATPRLTLPRPDGALRRQLGLPPSAPLVALNIHAGALCPERRWPAERFERLARRLLAETEATILLIGSPGEAAETARTAAAIGAHPRLINLAGRLALSRLVSLLAECALVISSDSGPAHLAAAAGAPTLALFGPESPARYGPRGVRVEVAYAPTPCSPCLSVQNAKRAPCRGQNECLRQIDVERVFQAARRALCGAPGSFGSLLREEAAKARE